MGAMAKSGIRADDENMPVRLQVPTWGVQVTPFRSRPPSLAHLAGMTLLDCPSRRRSGPPSPAGVVKPSADGGELPSGDMAWHRLLPPQQEMGPSILTAQVCLVPGLTGVNSRPAARPGPCYPSPSRRRSRLPSPRRCGDAPR